MKRVFVAGHNGMVGSAICRSLQKDGRYEIISKDHSSLDLLDQYKVHKFLKTEKPDSVIFAAAKVGGIFANNTYPADFIYENLQIQNNIIHGSHEANIQELLFLGSSCIYPKLAPQPISEEFLLTGKLETTNEPYAVAKIAGIKMCESYNRQFSRDYRSVMPTNLYGPGDNFHIENSHVIPALIRRFHEAKISNKKDIIVWGSGRPKREFLYVDDLADAILFLINIEQSEFKEFITIKDSHVNIGTGEDVSINELSNLIKKEINFDGEILFDTSKPDGPPRKLLNIDLLNKMGWNYNTGLEEGLNKTYKWFLKNEGNHRES
jgi:GDP-L-fucose synthase